MSVNNDVKCDVEVKVYPPKKLPLNNSKIEPKEVSNNPQEPPKQPTAEEKVGQIKNQLTLIHENAKELINQITNNLLSDVLQASTIIQNYQSELKRLQDLCTKNSIDFMPPKPKEPNRAERRQASGITKQKKTTR